MITDNLYLVYLLLLLCVIGLIGFFITRKKKSKQDIQQTHTSEEKQSSNTTTPQLKDNAADLTDFEQTLTPSQTNDASRSFQPESAQTAQTDPPIAGDSITEDSSAEKPITEKPITENSLEEKSLEETPLTETSLTETSLTSDSLPSNSLTNNSLANNSLANNSLTDDSLTDNSTGPQESFFSKVKSSLTRTKQSLTTPLHALFSSNQFDDDTLEELETLLLTADVGVEATTHIINQLQTQINNKTIKDNDALKSALKQQLSALLAASDHAAPTVSSDRPRVILMVGVNGVGKTTSIGKLAKRLQSEGNKVILAAGDTFRAAAVEQLQVWGERNHVPVVAQHTGADSASVIYDALESATAKGANYLIADTAGRLQNKENLMNELSKVVRVMRKIDPNAPHDVYLVLDACTGQNAISQAKEFIQSVGVTGIILTKLDGTAKGGVIFAIAKQFNLPICYIGMGEHIDDLKPFNSAEFIDALID